MRIQRLLYLPLIFDYGILIFNLHENGFYEISLCYFVELFISYLMNGY